MYPYPNNDLRPVFKVQLTSDNRYTDENGQMVYDMGPVSETTYPIPQITVDRLPHNAIQTSVYQPIYRPFELPNPYLQHPPLSPSGISFSTSEALPPHKGCKSWSHCPNCGIFVAEHIIQFLYFRLPFGHFSLLPHQNTSYYSIAIAIFISASMLVCIHS